MVASFGDRERKGKAGSEMMCPVLAHSLYLAGLPRGARGRRGGGGGGALDRCRYVIISSNLLERVPHLHTA